MYCGCLGRSSCISIHALLAESDSHLSMCNTPKKYFYPRSPCGERLYDTYAKVLRVNISIHALLAESDFRHWTTYLNCSLFLSTLSLRRATHDRWVDLLRFQHFYPRSPCGERRSGRPETRQSCAISIHALLAESDSMLIRLYCGCLDFYPRSPCGERLCLQM